MRYFVSYAFVDYVDMVDKRGPRIGNTIICRDEPICDLADVVEVESSIADRAGNYARSVSIINFIALPD